MRSPLATAVAIATALITLLLAYLIPSLVGNAGDQVRTLILSSAVLLAAVATLVAVISLFFAHLRKLRARRNPDRYSILTLAFFIITFVAGCGVYLLGAYQAQYQQIFVTSIQVPIESSLLAVLAVTLALASFRLFQRRRGVIAVTFLISALIFLFFNSGLVGMFEPLLPADLVGKLMGFIQMLPIAGGRGILLGIALGSIMAGLRILFGAERPYSG